MAIFTIESLRTALGEHEFMGLADRPRDGVLGVEDANRVNEAIAAGEGDINGRLGQERRYVVPLTGEQVTDDMRRHLLSAIVYHLHPKGRPVPKATRDAFNEACCWADDVGTGKAKLANTAAEPAPLRVPVVQSGPARVFTRSILRHLL